MATFNEAGAPTSRRYVAQQGIGTIMPNLSKTFQTFLPHSSVFALEREKLNFQGVFASKKRFGG